MMLSYFNWCILCSFLDLNCTLACTASTCGHVYKWQRKLIHKTNIFYYFSLRCTVSHFSYAPLIKCKITQKRNMILYSETTSVKRIYICITHCNFIVIRSERNEKMDLEGHYPQNTISHCLISNETQFTLHFIQSRISAMPEIRADLFLAISKTVMCLLTSLFF